MKLKSLSLILLGIFYLSFQAQTVLADDEHDKWIDVLSIDWVMSKPGGQVKQVKLDGDIATVKFADGRTDKVTSAKIRLRDGRTIQVRNGKAMNTAKIGTDRAQKSNVGGNQSVTVGSNKSE